MEFPELERLRGGYDWDAGMLIPFGSAWNSGAKEFLAGAVIAACFRKGAYAVLQSDVLRILFATSMTVLAHSGLNVFWDLVEDRDIETVCGENSPTDMIISPSRGLVEKFLTAELRWVPHREGWQDEEVAPEQ
jgi:hypothetical protein